MDMARAFNALEGLTADDDKTAPRFLSGFSHGPREGQHIDVGELTDLKAQ